MDQTRFDNANKLWADGRNEDAAREFHAMAEEEAGYPDGKAALLLNELNCYLQISELEKANEVMRRIRGLPVRDRFVQMIRDFGDACLTVQMGKLEEGVLKLTRILESNEEELRSPDLRYLCEQIQQRQGFALTSLRRYSEALPILKEASSFASDDSYPQLVQFYLGICFQETANPEPAKQSFLRAISLGLSHDLEADARYRLAILYYGGGALAQAKHQLEAALRLPDQTIKPELRKSIYQQMSRVCHYLKEFEEEKKYSKLAQA